MLRKARATKDRKLRAELIREAQNELKYVDATAHPELVNAISAKLLALQGRGGDTEIAHVTLGEMVLHPDQLSARTRAMIAQDLRSRGVDPRSRRVNDQSRINRTTGAQQFDSDTVANWKDTPGWANEFAVKGVYTPLWRPNPSQYNLAPTNPGSRLPIRLPSAPIGAPSGGRDAGGSSVNASGQAADGSEQTYQGRWNGTAADVGEAFMNEFNGIRQDGSKGELPSNEIRTDLSNQFRSMFLANPNVRLKFGAEIDPNDLGLIQNINPDDFDKGDIASFNVQDRYSKIGLLLPEYYVDRWGIVRLRTGEIRTHPSPVAGIISNLYSSPYWSQFNPLSALDSLDPRMP
ncbi:MAG: hypothetical protein KDE14_14385 [Rhodobacteraceae bacterium]|nr:hypothetical protein [Paracoccaceae bacterium]